MTTDELYLDSKNVTFASAVKQSTIQTEAIKIVFIVIFVVSFMEVFRYMK